MPVYFAEFSKKSGWRVMADYRGIGGDIIDICGAVDGEVARQTAEALNIHEGLK